MSTRVDVKISTCKNMVTSFQWHVHRPARRSTAAGMIVTVAASRGMGLNVGMAPSRCRAASSCRAVCLIGKVRGSRSVSTFGAIQSSGMVATDGLG